MAKRKRFSQLAVDEVADPIILAYQLGRKDAVTWSHHIKTSTSL
jgi:hypothetical protein